MKDFMEYNFNIIKIAIACFVPKGGGTPIHKNRKEHGLAFHTSGEKHYIFDSGVKITAKANDIVYLPKKSNYIVKSVVPGDCYAINFDLSEDIDFSPFSYRVKNTHQFLSFFKEAESYWDNKYAGFEMKCKAHVYNIICMMINEFDLGYISQSKSSILSPAIAYIHNEYTKDNIRISSLAELCGISEIYFRKLFTQWKGVTPLKYINHLKMERAKELLLSNMYTISQVSILSGFHDESYFSREFKKHFSVAPNEYKKASRK